MNHELLPCPFCGSHAAFGQIDDDANPDFGGEFISCSNHACDATSMMIFPTMADAKPLLIEKWNLRKHKGETVLVEALREAIAQPVQPDMPAICAALGFDPTNHHNAARCPYCTPSKSAQPVKPTALRGTDAQILIEREITASAIQGAMAYGYQNGEYPPDDSAWLRPFWEIGRRDAEREELIFTQPVQPAKAIHEPISPLTEPAQCVNCGGTFAPHAMDTGWIGRCECVAQPEQEPWPPEDTAYRPGGLAQSEQEPVANDHKIVECLTVLRPMVKGKWPHEYALEELAGYASPPQREWVGLTKEEATKLWDSTDDRDSWELLKRVEAKLKEKNE